MDRVDGQATPDTLGVPLPPPVPIHQPLPQVPLGGSPFPPIAEYGFLSDCETMALVAPSGNVDWLALVVLR
jgi:hypothetical protein